MASAPLVIPQNVQDLPDDFASRQVPTEAHEGRKAELAIHRTTNLGGDAKRYTPFFGDPDCFNHAVI
jgi:hypothetical protein